MESNSGVCKDKKTPILMLSSSIFVCTGLGITLGVAFNNIPIGLSIGAGVGTSIGIVLYRYLSSRTCTKKQ